VQLAKKATSNVAAASRRIGIAASEHIVRRAQGRAGPAPGRSVLDSLTRPPSVRCVFPNALQSDACPSGLQCERDHGWAVAFGERAGR
jgi:hypothetical protein